MNEELVQRVTFKDVFDTYGTFTTEWTNSGFPNTVLTSDNRALVYNLLYAKYANSTIASIDIDRFKKQVFSIIWQHGPAWQKKLAIQAAINTMSEADVSIRDTTVFNTAANPSTTPATNAFTALTKIDAQNAQQTKRNPLVGWAQLRELIEADFTSQFLDKFKKLFIVIVEGSEGLPPVLTIRGNHIYSEDVPADVVKQGDLYVTDTAIKQWDDGAWITIVDFSSIVSETDWGDIGGTLADQTDLKNALDALQNAINTLAGVVSGKSTVTGTNDGTNWLTITIDGATYSIPAGGGGSAAWGNITGTLSDQTDLRNALNSKLDKKTSVTTYNQVYVKLADGSQSSLDASAGAIAATVMLRDANGRTKVEAPSDDKDAANKKFVVDHVTGTNDGTNWTDITIGGETYAIPAGGGGGTQLYRHNILISDSANRVTFPIISSSNTAYTNATLVNYFGTNASKKICASGANYSNSRVKTAYQASGSDATHMTIYVIFDDDGSVDTDELDILYSSLTVTDTIETLS